MLMDALRVLVNNPFKESFYRKRKKNAINILTVFTIFHKKWSINSGHLLTNGYGNFSELAVK